MALLQTTRSFVRFVPGLNRFFNKPPAGPAAIEAANSVANCDEPVLDHPIAPIEPLLSLPEAVEPLAETGLAPEALALPAAEPPIEAPAPTATIAHPETAPASPAASVATARPACPRDPISERSPVSAAPTFPLVEPSTIVVGNNHYAPTVQHIILWCLASSAPHPIERTALIAMVMQKANRGTSVVSVARSELLRDGHIVLIGTQYAITPEGIAKLADNQGISTRERAVRTGEITPASFMHHSAAKVRLASILNLAVPTFRAPTWIGNALAALTKRLTGEALTTQPLDFEETLRPAIQDVFDLGYAVGCGQIALASPTAQAPELREIRIFAVPDNPPANIAPRPRAMRAERIEKDKQIFLEFLEGSSISAIATRRELQPFSVDKKIQAMRTLFRAGLLDLPPHALAAAKADAIRTLSIPDAPAHLSPVQRRQFCVYVEHLQNPSHQQIADAHGLTPRTVGIFVTAIRRLIRSGQLKLPDNLIKLADDDIARANKMARKSVRTRAPRGQNNAYEVYLSHLRGSPVAQLASEMNLSSRSVAVYISRMRNAFRLGVMTVPPELADIARADAETHKVGVNKFSPAFDTASQSIAT